MAKKSPVLFKAKHGYLSLTRKGLPSLKFSQHIELGHGEFLTSDADEIEFIRTHHLFSNGTIEEVYKE